MNRIKLDKKNKIAIGVIIGLIICIILGATFNIVRNVKDLFGSSGKKPDITENGNNRSKTESGT